MEVNNTARQSGKTFLAEMLEEITHASATFTMPLTRIKSFMEFLQMALESARRDERNGY